MLLEIFESEDISYNGGKRLKSFRYIVLIDKFNVTELAMKCGVLPETPYNIGYVAYYKKKIPQIYFTQNDYLDKVKGLLSYYFRYEGNFERTYARGVFNSTVVSLEIPTLAEKQARVNAKKQSLEQDFV